MFQISSYFNVRKLTCASYQYDSHAVQAHPLYSNPVQVVEWLQQLNNNDVQEVQRQDLQAVLTPNRGWEAEVQR